MKGLPLACQKPQILPPNTVPWILLFVPPIFPISSDFGEPSPILTNVRAERPSSKLVKWLVKQGRNPESWEKLYAGLNSQTKVTLGPLGSVQPLGEI